MDHRGERTENSVATAPQADDVGGDDATGAQAGTSGAPGGGRSGAGATAPSGSAGASGTGSTPTASISYSAARVIGNGSFGVVFQATVRETGETVAIKKVLQDKRYKNRELQIMRMLDHTNICKLKHCFYSSGEKQDEVYLNLVLEYIPETVYRVSRHYSKVKTSIPSIFIKLYIYQLLRALAYIHALNVTHRDIKPQNVRIALRALGIRIWGPTVTISHVWTLQSKSGIDFSLTGNSSCFPPERRCATRDLHELGCANVAHYD